MARCSWLSTALVLGGLLVGCSQGGHELAINLRTDLVPGVEIDAIEVVVDDEASMPVTALASQDFQAGARVHESSGLATGMHRVTVRLSRAGAAVVERDFAVRLPGSLIFTAVLTRDCRGVECPGEGSVTATECLGGRCVAPECGTDETVDDPTCGTPECELDSDCTASAPCVRPVCLANGVCFEASDALACTSPLVCDPDEGYVSVSVREDAGIPGDAGADAGASDAGGCRTDVDCDDGIACTSDVCTPGVACTSSPDDARCTASPAGTCRPGTPGADPVTGCGYDGCDLTVCVPRGPCEFATCDGSVCTLVPKDAGVECRAAAGFCDVAEVCDGVSPACPVDAFMPARTDCPPEPCVMRQCTGFGPDCFSVATSIDGTPCDTPERCGRETCSSGMCVGGGASCPEGLDCECGSCMPEGTVCS